MPSRPVGEELLSQNIDGTDISRSCAFPQYSVVNKTLLTTREDKMPNFRSTGLPVMAFCLSILAGSGAFADDCSNPIGYISNPTCPPGSVAYQAAQNQPGTLPYQMQQQQQQQEQCGSPSGYLFNFSCPPGSVAYQEQQRQAAEAADPRNQNDPHSRYYLGTPAEQCEAAKHSLFCVLGVSCATPAHLNCGQEEAGPSPRHRHRQSSSNLR